MATSFTSHATAAQELVHALERALALSLSQWGDATRQSFDRRHAEVAVASGRKVASELSAFAQELSMALASLRQ